MGGSACLIWTQEVLRYWTPVSVWSITNTRLEHKGVYMCTWYQVTLGQRLIIYFVVVSSDLWPYVLDTWVKSAGELDQMAGKLSQVSPEYRYWETRRAAVSGVETQSENWGVDELGEAMEKAFQSALRKF